jgi:hypothetical protein
MTRYYMEFMATGIETPAKRCPITGQIDCEQRTCEIHYMNAPLDMQCSNSTLNLWADEPLSEVRERDYLD